MATASPLPMGTPMPLRALHLAARLWFSVAAVGLWIFAAYVAIHYGGSALRGDMDAWNDVFPGGHIPGDTIGNAAVAVHVLLAVMIIAAGPLQLIPWIRRNAPGVHRWLGRIFAMGGSLAAVAGLYLVWIRGETAGDLPQNLGITLDAILILGFAMVAIRAARRRDFRAHRRWALRLFLVVNAVWFFRIGLSLWLMLHQRPVGFDPDTFSGPFLTFLAFSQTLLPLLILEGYLRARDGGSVSARATMAGVLGISALLTAGGIFAATMILWKPFL